MDRELIDDIGYLPLPLGYVPESYPHGLPVPALPEVTREVIDNADCDSSDCTGPTLSPLPHPVRRRPGALPPTLVAVAAGEAPESRPDVLHGLMSVVADLRTLAELLDDVEECKYSAAGLLVELVPLLATLASRPVHAGLAAELRRRPRTGPGLTASLLLVLQDLAPLGGLLHEVERRRYTAAELLVTVFPLVLSLLGVSPGRGLAMELTEQEFLAKEARRRRLARNHSLKGGHASAGDEETVLEETGVGEAEADDGSDRDGFFAPDLGGEGGP